jgi:hypothetical protein
LKGSGEFLAIAQVDAWLESPTLVMPGESAEPAAREREDADIP